MKLKMDEFGPFFFVIFVIVFTIGLIQMLGLGYRGLRFVANYEETTAEVVDCTSEYHADRTGRYFVYEIFVKGIPYPMPRFLHRVKHARRSNMSLLAMTPASTSDHHPIPTIPTFTLSMTRSLVVRPRR